MPDISGAPKTQIIPVFRNETNYFSTRKQNDSKGLKELKAKHQRSELELNYFNIILRKETDLAQITAKSRAKRPRKRARNAQ